MDLNDFYNEIYFYINKAQGGWYSPAELDLIVDRAQMTLFNRYYLQYATSQRMADALLPFKTPLSFTTASNGFVAIPSTYMDLISIYTTVTYDDDVTRQRAVDIVTENQLAIRLNSQVNPVTVYDPVGVQMAGGHVQLYPQMVHAGVVTFLSRPNKPVFSYTLVSGRVIVYNQGASTQLQWNDKDFKSIALIALEELGINLSEQDLIQWGAAKNQQNFTSNMVE